MHTGSHSTPFQPTYFKPYKQLPLLSLRQHLITASLALVHFQLHSDRQVAPLLKKPSLASTQVKNCQLFSLLRFLSKTVERITFKQAF